MTINIGKTPQLFIDDLIVDETNGVTSTLHQPAKYAGNPIMTPLYPWEGRLTLYGTVWRNEETGRFRMWYQGYGGMGIPRMGDDTSDSPWKGFDGRQPPLHHRLRHLGRRCLLGAAQPRSDRIRRLPRQQSRDA